MSMRDAFTKLGLAGSALAGSAPAGSAPVVTTPSEVSFSETVLKHGAALLRLPGQTEKTLAGRLAAALDGTGAGRSRWQTWLEGQVGNLPSGVAREVRADLWDTHKGLPTWSGHHQMVVDALRSGSCATFVVAQKGEEKVASQQTFPSPLEGESQDAYLARVRAWADPLPERVVKRLTGGDDAVIHSYGVFRSFIDGVQARRAAAIVADLERRISGIDSPEGLEAFELEARYTVPPAQLCEALGRHPQIWGSRHLLHEEQVVPTVEPVWDDLSDEVLFLAVVRGWFTSGARAELARRFGEEVILPTGTYGWRYYGPLGEALPVTATDSAGPPVGAVSSEDRPGQGRVYRLKSGMRYLSSAEADALRHLQQGAGGPLEIHPNVLRTWQRHPTAGWGSFQAMAWGHRVVVGVDDRLAIHMDRLAHLQQGHPELVTRELRRISGEVVKTEKGIRVVPTPKGASAPVPSTYLVLLESGTSSHGRHGVMGSLRLPRSGQQAPCASGTGHSNGGGQHRAVVFAAVSKGRPLLLEDGAGIEWSEAGPVEVAGLGTVSGGARKPL